MANPDIPRLEGIAREGRARILRMLTHAGSGHPGGSLSVIDLRASSRRPPRDAAQAGQPAPGPSRPRRAAGHRGRDGLARPGLSVAMGMALGLKLAGKSARVY